MSSSKHTRTESDTSTATSLSTPVGANKAKLPSWVCPFSGRSLTQIALNHTYIPTHIFSLHVSKYLTYREPVEGALFVFGGRSGRLGDARQYLSSVEFLDPTSLEWRSGPDMKFARVGLAAAYLNGSFFVIGGYNQQSGDPQKSVERLDVGSMKWTDCAPLLVPRYGHSACACGGKVYVMGGDHSGVLIPFAERYDPNTDAWERIPDMPIRVAASRAVSMDEKIYLLGGCDPSVPGDRASDAILMFDPLVNRWTVLGKRMTTGRTAFSLASLTDGGGVVIAGGFDLSTRPEVEMKSVEVIRDLANLSGDQPREAAIPELPIPRAGCQGVAIPTALLPVGLAKASALPFIVLGGEYIDPLTGRCKVFDNATMLINKKFAASMPHVEAPKVTSSVKGLSGIAGRAILALKRRRHIILETTDGGRSSGGDSPLQWSDQVLPPMTNKRTAFAACVGTVWPKGFKYDHDLQIEERIMAESDAGTKDRSRTLWPADMLHEWFQGAVL